MEYIDIFDENNNSIGNNMKLFSYATQSENKILIMQ